MPKENNSAYIVDVKSNHFWLNIKMRQCTGEYHVRGKWIL